MSNRIFQEVQAGSRLLNQKKEEIEWFSSTLRGIARKVVRETVEEMNILRPHIENSVEKSSAIITFRGVISSGDGFRPLSFQLYIIDNYGNEGELFSCPWLPGYPWSISSGKQTVYISAIHAQLDVLYEVVEELLDGCSDLNVSRVLNGRFRKRVKDLREFDREDTT